MPSALESFRARRGLTLQAMADAMGIRSRGQLSSIEAGERPAGLRLSLQIHQFTDGEVPAHELVTPEDRVLLKFFAESCARTAAA